METRTRSAGKFLFEGDEKLYVRGVTYGTFRPDAGGAEYRPETVARDFELMHRHGFNAVRTYTPPPPWLLDEAAARGLRVMVGLPWEHHVAFLEDAGRARDIERRVGAAMRPLAGHPAVLCVAIGNEIPAPVVRWHGARHIERFLEGLYGVVKREDPGALVTYVNYPTTEYLDLPFLDLVCFNVFLEDEDRYRAYLARLQNVAGDRPLVLTEVGLDARRHGLDAQASSLDWQLRAAFGGGAAGAFVFSWTDEWFRGGFDVEDWSFGITTRDREPKPALRAVEQAFAEAPFPKDLEWPRISVVVCSYNGGRTIRQTLEHLDRQAYPEFEVIVVDDGSTDDTAAIAAAFDVRVIRTENRGLSAARNTGLEAASGEIVAYIDDDAYPDPHWLTYLGAAFLSSEHAGIGGPNIPPPGDGSIADCVANAPGGPIHVLLTDEIAEHIPGCNMAFRRDALLAIGGFDPRFRSAGDDVDICWRLQDRGWTIGFAPSAVVWHHRRNSVRTYWRQQKGYGKAEALLEAKWPDKYNGAGHVTWTGRVYAGARPLRHRIYHGVWGQAPFQRVYARAEGALLAQLPAMPEWHLVLLVLAALTGLGALWTPLLFAAPVLAVALAVTVARAVRAGLRAEFAGPIRSLRGRVGRRALTAVLHLAQPVARLIGRLRHGLTPWRRRGGAGLRAPRYRSWEIWSEQWRAPADWLRALEGALRERGVPVVHGGPFDRWDLEARSGALTGVRIRTAVEEHGGGRQLLRIRAWPRCSAAAILAVGALAGLSAAGFSDHGHAAAAVLVALAALLTAHLVRGLGTASAIVRAAVGSIGGAAP